MHNNVFLWTSVVYNADIVFRGKKLWHLEQMKQ